MKRILLFISYLILGSNTYAQVVCAGVSPASIAGNYDFSWAEPANNWSSPDFSIPGTSVSGELMLVDDGTAGINPVSGVPLANYGCSSPLVNNLSGKIALVYRYDGVTPSTLCFLYDKAIIAQNAGAIAVLIVNRPDGPEDVGGGGTVGPNVTVPVVMVSFSDGELLRAEMQNGPVTMFLGNKSGLFANDIGITTNTKLISKSYGVIAKLAGNGSEFNFDLGTRVYNYGTNDQSNITVTANINNPSGTSVYSSVAGPISILSGDSADVAPGNLFSFPTFSLSSYPIGKYTLNYTVSLGGTDEYPGDDSTATYFIINDSIFSYSKLDPNTLLPIPSNGYRPASNNSTYSTCMVIDNPNASRIGVTGIYFSASTAYGSGISLTGEEMALNLYRWEDVFVDLNDGALAFNNLNSVAFGYYYYPGDFQSQTVYGEFNTGAILEDNQRYLACVQTVNTGIYLGHDKKTNYLWNESYYLQPIAPNESDGTYYASGFGMEIPSSMALRICSVDGPNSCNWGVPENEKELVKIYPNPANDILTISIAADGMVDLQITDLSGKRIKDHRLSLLNGEIKLDVSGFESGMYLFKITLENGNSMLYTVVKN